MEISYLGHSSFRLRSKEITLVTDPFDPKKVGLKFPAVKADIVTVSHGHPDHSFLDGVEGAVTRSEVFIVDRPGEYEVGGVEVRALKTYHDKKEGKERGENLIMVIRMDDIFVVHLGDLGHVLSEKRIEDIGVVDVLMVPIGGEVNLDAKLAVEVVSQLEPSLVIPMHYNVPGLAEGMPKLGELDDFLKSMGAETPERTKRLKVTRDMLTENVGVVVMET